MVIMFDTKVKRLLLDGGGGITGVEATHLNKGDSISHLYAPSVILCAGGLEANREPRKAFMGPEQEPAHVCYTP